MNTVKVGILLFFISGLITLFPNTLLAQITIKCATVAPEGTEWTKLARKASEEVEQKIGIKISWYFSGAAGDEPEIAKNMKEKKIDCAALTGNGLTYLVAPARVIELPLLFKDPSEINRIRNDMSSLLAKIARDYKLKFIHLAEFGEVHVFSKTPIRTVEDVRNKRVWIWKGDILAEHMGKVLQEEYNIKPVPVPLNDVPNYLQNIEVLYNTSYGLTSLGWDKGVKYYITQPLTVSFVGLIINQDVFNQLDPQKQKELEEILKNFIEMISQMNRRNNQNAIEVMKSKGFSATTLPEDEVKKLENMFQERIWNGLKEKLYPSWLLTEVLTRLSEYRVKRR
ncbi:MAG: TRAP transporter substrate-binding protein DctP [Candidatus Calescibacterium sp.]|nr:TRAP transporter substrate-binding protein DctP [Candidatus Calescibacterium sp.]MCX7734843.1 TRAP transporter substrate-binding protein DctP [bacterium]MDW8087726.1 TRAP transporter substrate-binding protein DctP [Candidatus Calescibacterium sp.]